MKRFLKTFVSLILVLCTIAVMVPVKAEAAKSSVKLNKTTATVTEGEKVKLKITGTEADVTWSSSDKAIATVSKKGVVTTKKEGNVIITAKVGSKKYKCKITVERKLSDEEIIWNYLYEKLGNKRGAAALMGNLWAESGLKSNNLQNYFEKKCGLNDEEYTKAVDKGTYTNFVHDAAGYGLAQWTYWSRKQGLYNFAKQKKKSIGDLNMQLDYLIYELQKNYPIVYNNLRTTKSLKESSNYVLFYYEKPANQSVAVQEIRAAYGKIFYNKYGKKK